MFELHDVSETTPLEHEFGCVSTEVSRTLFSPLTVSTFRA